MRSNKAPTGTAGGRRYSFFKGTCGSNVPPKHTRAPNDYAGASTGAGAELRQSHRHVPSREPAAVTIRHTIDAQSPLYSETGSVETVMAAAVESQQDYSWSDIRWSEGF
jgi:hypothetical protein